MSPLPGLCVYGAATAPRPRTQHCARKSSKSARFAASTRAARRRQTCERVVSLSPHALQDEAAAQGLAAHYLIAAVHSAVVTDTYDPTARWRQGPETKAVSRQGQHARAVQNSHPVTHTSSRVLLRCPKRPGSRGDSTLRPLRGTTKHSRAAPAKSARSCLVAHTCHRHRAPVMCPKQRPTLLEPVLYPNLPPVLSRYLADLYRDLEVRDRPISGLEL